MNGFRWPLGLSLAAHASVIALLFLLPAPAPPAAPPPIEGGIEVAFAPALPPPKPPAPPRTPQPEKPKPPPPPPPPPVETTPPPAPPPPPPVETTPPAPEAEVAVPLPPPPKPPVPPLRRAPVRRVERVHPLETPPRDVPIAPAAPTQQAVLPAARVSPPRAPAAISPGYAALLGNWLNSHKRYPESARERREEGRAVLRFAVERSGRISDFAIVKSTGYRDLDAAVAEMMRGAILPPFPADMPEASVSVSVTIRFSLEQ